MTSVDAGLQSQPLRRSRLNVDERRQQIVDAATHLITKSGYRGFSIQQAADRCGMSLPGLLHHVGSKDKLLIAVLENQEAHDELAFFEELSRGAAGEGIVPATDRVTLKRACSLVVGRNARNPEFVRLFMVLRVEALNNDHPAHEYFMERERRVLSAFRDLAKHETSRPDELASGVMALMDGLQIQWLLNPDAFDLVERWDELAANMLVE